MPVAVELPRTTPEAEGLRSGAITAFIDSVEAKKLELHSLMVLRHGKVVAEGWWEPYKKQEIHLLYSLTKSFMSTGIGIAIDEGLLSLDDLVASFFPDELPSEPSENLLAMKVRHLLSMSTGNDSEDNSDPDGNWVRAFLRQQVPYPPGTHFFYNSLASYMLSAILQKVTGISTLDYLKPRLFEPLGIDRISWERCPRGTYIGGWGISLETESIAKLGQLYLQSGMWQGRRLVSEGWVQEATKFQVDNSSGGNPDWKQGYGFQFWRGRHDSYRGDGAFGQYCLVLPKESMVVAITSSVDDMQAVLDSVWSELLPSRNEVGTRDPYLHERLGSLCLSGPSGEAASESENSISGVRFRSSLPGSLVQEYAVEFSPPGCEIAWRDSKGAHKLVAGRGSWIIGKSDFDAVEEREVASWGAWTTLNTYVVRLLDLHSPYRLEISFHFEPDTLQVKIRRKGRFGPSEGETFEGVA